MPESSRSSSQHSDPVATPPVPPSTESPVITKNLNYNLPVKLNRDNYNYWKALVLPAIRALELEEFINGEKLCPNKYIEGLDSSGAVKEVTINPTFTAWRRLDQFLLSWLLSTISENLIGLVTKCVSSLETWRTLEKLFSQQSMAKVFQLQQQLQSLKKGSTSIAEYILKAKEIGDGLSAAGEEVSDRILLGSVLNGLGHEFDPVVVHISSQQNSMSLYEAQYLLLIHEQRIEHLNTGGSTGVVPSANFVSNSSGNRFNNKDSGTDNGRDSNIRGKRGRGGRWTNSNNRPVCQICGRIGHSAPKCYNRYDRNCQGPSNTNNGGSGGNQRILQVNNHSHPQDARMNNNFNQFAPQANYNQSSAFIASPEVVCDPSWYADSGASSHVTSDIGQGFQDSVAQRNS